MPLVEQKLLTLPVHLSWPPVFSGVHVTRTLVLCVCIVDIVDRSFGYCVFCPASIYGFWWPLWYLQTLFIILWKYCFHFNKPKKNTKQEKKLEMWERENKPCQVDNSGFSLHIGNNYSIYSWNIPAEKVCKGVKFYIYFNIHFLTFSSISCGWYSSWSRTLVV